MKIDFDQQNTLKSNVLKNIIFSTFFARPKLYHVCHIKVSNPSPFIKVRKVYHPLLSEFQFLLFYIFWMKMVRKRVCKGICICILLIQPHEQSTKAVCVYGREYYVNDLRYKFLYFTSQKRCFSNFLTFSCTWNYIVCFLLL